MGAELFLRAMFWCSWLYPELFLLAFRWNESYKKDLFSSRIDTTKALAQAIATSPSPPQSWVLVSGVGKCFVSQKGSDIVICCKLSEHIGYRLYKKGCLLLCYLLWLTACYKPSQTAQYTEDSEWTPFDLLSKLVKEWEASALLPDDVAKTTKQVVIRPGMYQPY